MTVANIYDCILQSTSKEFSADLILVSVSLELIHNNSETNAKQFTYRVSQEKTMTRLAGCGIKSMRPIFKTEMLIYQPKTNFVW